MGLMDREELAGEYRTRGEVDVVEDEVQYVIDIAIVESWGGTPTPNASCHEKGGKLTYS